MCKVNPKTEIVDVTPEMAVEWLKRNKNNRNLDERVLRLYVRDMKNGNWDMNGETVKFDIAGELKDGQHRLQAVVLSGCTVKMMVVTGLNPDVMKTIDVGKKRTVGDVVRLYGISNANTVAAAINGKLQFDQKRGSGTANNARTVSSCDVLEEYDKDPNFWHDMVSMGSRLSKANRCILSTGQYGAVMGYLIKSKKHPTEKVKMFFSELTEIEPTGNTALIYLRRRLVNAKITNKNISYVIKIKLIIKTWNAYITGRQLKQVIYNPETDKDIWFI